MAASTALKRPSATPAPQEVTRKAATLERMRPFATPARTSQRTRIRRPSTVIGPAPRGEAAGTLAALFAAASDS